MWPAPRLGRPKLEQALVQMTLSLTALKERSTINNFDFAAPTALSMLQADSSGRDDAGPVGCLPGQAAASGDLVSWEFLVSQPGHFQGATVVGRAF